MSEIKLQFDPNQRHQYEAVDAVVSLFEGQKRRETSLSPIRGVLESGPARKSIKRPAMIHFSLAVT